MNRTKPFSIYILCVSFLFLSSCRVFDDVNTVAFKGIRGQMFIPIAMAHFSVDAAQRIYALDSLKDSSEVFVTSLDAFFTSPADTFKVSFDPYIFYFGNDTLQYNDVVFPSYEGYVQSDTLISVVKIVFETPKKEGQRCIEKVYIVTDKEVNRDAEFLPCAISIKLD